MGWPCPALRAFNKVTRHIAQSLNNESQESHPRLILSLPNPNPFSDTRQPYSKRCSALDELSWGRRRRATHCEGR